MCCHGRQNSPCSTGYPSTGRAAPLPVKGFSPPPLEQARNSQAREVFPGVVGSKARLCCCCLWEWEQLNTPHIAWLGALKGLHWSFLESPGAAGLGQGHWGHTEGPDRLVSSLGLSLSLVPASLPAGTGAFQCLVQAQPGSGAGRLSQVLPLSCSPSIWECHGPCALL